MPEFFLKTFSRRVCYSLPSNAWAWTGIAFFALALSLLLLFLLSQRSGARKTGFFGALLALILSGISLLNAFWQKNEWQDRLGAVVTAAVVSVKSAPSDASGADLFILHEGTVLKIKDTVGEWSNVSIADGREGWVRTSGVETIVPL